MIFEKIKNKYSPEEEAGRISFTSLLAFIFFCFGKVNCLVAFPLAIAEHSLANACLVTAAVSIVLSVILSLFDLRRFDKKYEPSKEELLEWANKMGFEIREKNKL